MPPIYSTNLATNVFGGIGPLYALSLFNMSVIPGLFSGATWFTAKLTLSFNVPPSIHSLPVCQPSTVGGLRRCCPINALASASDFKLGSGNLCVPASFIVLVISSTGDFTLLCLDSLKKSELNNVFNIVRISPPDSEYAVTRVFMASGS